MTEDHIIPLKIRQKMADLGFQATNWVELTNYHSVVAIREDRHFNVQLNKSDMTVSSIHQLNYRWNATGAKILDVTRVLVEQKG